MMLNVVSHADCLWTWPLVKYVYCSFLTSDRIVWYFLMLSIESSLWLLNINIFCWICELQMLSHNRERSFKFAFYCYSVKPRLKWVTCPASESCNFNGTQTTILLVGESFFILVKNSFLILCLKKILLTSFSFPNWSLFCLFFYHICSLFLCCVRLWPQMNFFSFLSIKMFYFHKTTIP